MHARELVELASLAAAYGRILMRGPQTLSEESVQRYWVDSKIRLDRWTSQLSRVSDEPVYLADETFAPAARPSWDEVRVLIEEIFLSDVLTRVWTAVGVGVDRAQGKSEAEPVLRSVLIGHMEACNRAMRILLELPHKWSAAAAALNRTRTIAGRWTDVLIAVLSIDDDLTSLAVDRRRAQKMADELRSRASRGDSGCNHAALIGPLLATMRVQSTAQSPNEELNARIAGSVVTCFRPALFDGAGVLRFEWLYRLHQVTLDSQLMIDEWLEGESTSKGRRELSHPTLPSPRWPFESSAGDTN